MKIELIEGKLFVDGCEWVKKEGEQVEPVYTVEYCKANKVAIFCPDADLFNNVRRIFGESEIGEEAMNIDANCISHYDNPWCKHHGKNFYRSAGYTIIPASQFIEHNQPATVEQAEPKWCESWEVLECMNHLNAVISRNEDGTFGESKATINQIVENNFTTIHSIRNKQTQEEFTVGDKAAFGSAGWFMINKIEIVAGEVVLTDAAGYHNQADVCHPYTVPALPTLQEVFKKVQPKYMLGVSNTVVLNGKENAGLSGWQNQLSTESQCKQLQAYIALRNIADYYNGEVGWMPIKCINFSINRYDNGKWLVGQSDTINDIPLPMEVCFKQREHAENAISILKKAGLLEALKG